MAPAVHVHVHVNVNVDVDVIGFFLLVPARPRRVNQICADRNDA